MRAKLDRKAFPRDPTRMGVIATINQYLRMIKFSHTIFALPFAGIALIEALRNDARSRDELILLVVQVLVCMVALRSAAMGFNRLADKLFDAKNPRTTLREIPAGILSARSVSLFVALSLIIFVIVAFTINLTAGLLSPVAILLVLGYSYTKRFTMLSHYVLGVAIGLVPTATWIAIRGTIDTVLPVVWSFGLLLYIAGFDILYACQDTEFDREAGLHSIPSRLGIPAALWIARATHLFAAALFFYSGVIAGTGILFHGAVALIAVLFLTEHLLVRPDRLHQIPIAFFHINASISTILFFGLALDRYLF